MNWKVLYSPASQRQLRKLDRQVSARLLLYMRELLTKSSSPYEQGKQLTGVWSKYWRYRVGDYRIICVLRDAELLVSVVRVGHRSRVYLNPPQ